MERPAIVPREEALLAIPDSPTTLEFRALALDPKSAIYRSGQGLLLVDEASWMVGATGAVKDDDFAWLSGSLGTQCEIVADEPARDSLGHVLSFEPARIFTLDAPWHTVAFHRSDCSLRLLEPGDSIAHLPDELRGELTYVRPRVAIFASFVDGTPVSFAYSSSETETLADISIDTWEGYRNRGLAAATAAALIDRVVRDGKSPVWGALESNAPSLRLAEKLGFRREAGRLFVADASPCAH